MPAVAALAGRGASTFRARTVVPSITLTSHASMLSGFPPSAHGLRWSDYLPERGFIRVPTVFAAAKAAGLRTVMVVGKPELAHLNLPRSVDRFHELTGDADVTVTALREIAAGFDLLFAHLPDTDRAGHRAGWMSDEYLAGVAAADAAVGRLASALPADVTLIVTGDHGGHSSTHGTPTDDDTLVPWIIVGPGVAPARELTSRVTTMDTAATAAWVLGVRLDARASGRVVREAFAPRGRTGQSGSAAAAPARN
jgi:Type I phosphodiesterase / nucleotide pyrophosphatase